MENKAKWLNQHDILDPTDSDLLDASSSVHEFRGGLPKEEAEHRAYGDYLRNHAIDSAAHHLLGMRASFAANNTSAAKRHGEAYALAMGHLGYSPTGTPPKEILDRTKDSGKSPYSFKAHQADSFFEPKVEIPGIKEKPENKTLELVERLKSLRVKQPVPS